MFLRGQIHSYQGLSILSSNYTLHFMVESPCLNHFYFSHVAPNTFQCPPFYHLLNCHQQKVQYQTQQTHHYLSLDFHSLIHLFYQCPYWTIYIFWIVVIPYWMDLLMLAVHLWCQIYCYLIAFDHK